MNRRQRGITLVEVLLAIMVSLVVIFSAGNAYIVGAKYGTQMNEGRDLAARQAAFEGMLADLFRHAYLDSDTTNTTTFFVSGDAITSATPQTGGSGSGSGSSDPNSLVFTVIGRRLPSTLLASPDDFETNNQKFGPQGGVSEVQLGTTPIGTDPNSGQPGGLYLRVQAPSDADPSQGGYESKISDDLDTISFEFYDGTDWQTTWDTTTMTTRRLPSAVRVTYRMKDETVDHILVFQVPSSDVTPDNPVTQDTPTT